MNIVTSKKTGLSSGLMGMKFMRASELQESKQEKESKRQELVHSSHWVLPKKGKKQDSSSSPAITKHDDLGFSDFLEITSTESTTQNGRRGYGKLAKDQSDSESESEDEKDDEKDADDKSKDADKPLKRKKSHKESEMDPEERKRREKAQAKILRQMKSISNSK